MFWGRALFQEELLPSDSGNVLWGTKGSKGQSAAHKKQTKGFKAVTFRKSAACQGDVEGFFSDSSNASSASNTGIMPALVIYYIDVSLLCTK